MKRHVVLALWLTSLAAGPVFAQTGQINGVVSDNTGGVVPGALVKAVEVATGLSRDTTTGADGRYTFTSLRPTTYDLVVELSGFRPSHRNGRAVASQSEPHDQFLDRARHARGNRHRLRRIADRGCLVGNAERSRRFEADRRVAAERPRCRDAEHAGAGHGVDDGGSGIGQDDPRRAPHVDQWDRIATGLVPSGRHEPFRPVLPAESALPVSRCAAGIQHSDQQLQRRPGEQRRRGRQRRHEVWHQRAARRGVRLSARRRVHREELLCVRKGLPEAQAVPAALPAGRSFATRSSSSPAGKARRSTTAARTWCSLRQRPTNATATSPPAARPAMSPSSIHRRA